MRARCEAPVEYATVEHTADAGIVVRGRDPAELLAKAALALADLEFNPDEVEKRCRHAVHLEEGEFATLLVRWLNELIVLREIDEFLWSAVEVEWIEGRGLSAILHGERFDAARHAPRTGLKAATYHYLQVLQDEEGWQARVIFDV